MLTYSYPSLARPVLIRASAERKQTQYLEHITGKLHQIQVLQQGKLIIKKKLWLLKITSFFDDFLVNLAIEVIPTIPPTRNTMLNTHSIGF